MRPARADGKYTATASGVSPQGGSYPIDHGYYYGGSTTDASVLIKVANQSVQVNGATPSKTIYVGWNISILLSLYKDGYPAGGGTIASDSSAGLVAVQTKPDGSWTRTFSDGPASNSVTFTTNTSGSWTIDAASAITDPAGNTTLADTGGKFTTIDVYDI